ncbi:MAG: dTMP kinase [Candidatus Levybacteria bacterium]|nr:dTMP kinase [Candidatus Levybacteria bacterium]
MKNHIEFDLDFKKNTYGGLYIVLEGINASGKSTQLELLKEYFEKQGKTVVVTNEPNEYLAIGRMIREIITKTRDVPPAALQYLYTADRIVNHETIIIPALKKGHVVLSSRSFWSAIVYGTLDKEGSYDKKTMDLLLVAQGILSMYHQIMLSDFTFYLDVSLETIMQRIQAMGKEQDIYEDREKLSQLLAGYNWVVQQFPDVFTTIDSQQPVEKVTEEIILRLSS